MKEFNVSHPEKIIYPKGNIKKIDVINYYIDVANLMLPFIRNRLLSVIRCLKGVGDSCFFNKHLPKCEIVHSFKDRGEEYFFITDVTELIYLVQLGTIEFHVWASDVKAINHPNFMVFDLDPDENLPLEVLRDGVKKVKSVLDELKLKSYLKTSGGKGYHIVVPISKFKNWAQFYDFSKKIAEYCENMWQTIFTTNIKKNKRKGKIFIDYMRNNRASTCVAPFSLRTRDNATISMPIPWSDLESVKPNEVTIKNYKKYLNDAWNDFNRK